LGNEPFKTSHGDIQPRTMHLRKTTTTTENNIEEPINKVNLYPSPYLSPNLRDNAFYKPSQHSAYHKALTQEYKAPLSPILLENLKVSKVNPEHDCAKSDIFSLGVSLLATCTN